jgi:hypothetical protein
MIKRVYVLDEDVQEPLGWARDYTINARYLYRLEGLKCGQPDSILLKLSMKRGFTIITRDRGLVLASLVKNNPIVYLTPHDGYHLIKPQTEKITNIEGEFGTQRTFTGCEVHHELLGMPF